MKAHANEKTSIEGHIKWFTRIAWICIVSGVLGMVAYLIVHSLFLMHKVECPLFIFRSGFSAYMSGPVYAFWALAGFFFIYVAFLGQRLQLLNQQEDIQSSQQAIEKQFSMQQQQTFENSFFQLLSMVNNIISSMNIKDGNGIVECCGRDCFTYLYNELRRPMNFIRHKTASKEQPEKEKICQHFLNMKNLSNDDTVNIVYDFYFLKYQNILGHYYRSLYHVFKFVKNSDFTFEVQKKYTSIIRSQLSAGELVFLFYNGLHNNGEEKFNPLIKKYQLFENLNVDLIFNQEHLMLYDINAYGDNIDWL